MSRNLIVAANWKLNKGPADATAFLDAFVPKVEAFAGSAEIVIAAPFVTIPSVVAQLAGNSRIAVAAQNCSEQESGAFTGEVSAAMLKEVGAQYIITGHSERRSIYGESDATINAKNKAILAQGLKPIFCIGETLEEREGGKLESVLRTQITDGLKDIDSLENIVIAYEPVWAIGTGVTATAEQAQDTQQFVRSVIAELYNQETADAVQIQYGGSVKPGNAGELLGQQDIDGALVGGAALEADSFFGILENSAQ
ncbi:triose-phosphate isomerase [Rubritalea marina]|uniref:triose-phosphate isomerase n=1 Tax=Rubritalea marina TaxID=361055 RepID=UPI00036A3578|nr:triose-phosphate isomerase [Rubritalea marina]